MQLRLCSCINRLLTKTSMSAVLDVKQVYAVDLHRGEYVLLLSKFTEGNFANKYRKQAHQWLL